MTAAEYRKSLAEKASPGKREHKFGAKAVKHSGMSFASKLEAAVYDLLHLQSLAGEIEIVKQQSHVYLTDARVTYIADFLCKDLKTGEEFFVEAKGYETPEWRIKLRLWRHYGPAPLHIYKGSHTRVYLDEVVTPKGGNNGDDV